MPRTLWQFGVAPLVLIGGLSASLANAQAPNGHEKSIMIINQRPDAPFVFTDMDTNKDDFITKDEAKGPLTHAFGHIDKNNDNRISKDEFSTVKISMVKKCHVMHGEPKEGARKSLHFKGLMVMRFDSDTPMKRADYLAQAQQQFDEMDANKDGILSLDEQRPAPPHDMVDGPEGECPPPPLPPLPPLPPKGAPMNPPAPPLAPVKPN